MGYIIVECSLQLTIVNNLFIVLMHNSQKGGPFNPLATPNITEANRKKIVAPDNKETITKDFLKEEENGLNS